MKNAFDIVRDFEAALCEYTGAPYAVAVNSCTNALFLSLKYHHKSSKQRTFWATTVDIPKYTYISVPMQIKLSGHDVSFRHEGWTGAYRLKPYNIWDSARYLTSSIYTDIKNAAINSKELQDGTGIVPSEKKYPYVCVSFHWAKTLGIQQGGAILHADQNFDIWARKARFDGRTEGIAPKDDKFDMVGYHMYMSPEVAAEGLVRLMHLPKNNLPLPNDDYPDLSQIGLFK